MNLNFKGQKFLFDSLLQLGNEAVYMNLADCFDAWLSSANDRLGNGRTSFEIDSGFTKNRRPHLVQFSKDMINE